MTLEIPEEALAGHWDNNHRPDPAELSRILTDRITLRGRSALHVLSRRPDATVEEFRAAMAESQLRSESQPCDADDLVLRTMIPADLGIRVVERCSRAGGPTVAAITATALEMWLEVMDELDAVEAEGGAA